MGTVKNIIKRTLGSSRATIPGPLRRKLLFLYHVCGLGGVETSMINKAEALRPLGVEVCALFYSYWGEGGRIIALPPGFVVETEEEARVRFIREYSPNAIIIVDTPQAFKTVIRAGVRCPLLFETHMPDARYLEHRVLPGARHPRVSCVVVPSEFNRSVLAEHGINPSSVRVIPNPIDLGCFRPDPGSDILEQLELPHDRRLVLFVGRLEAQKNPLEFIRVVAGLINQDARVHCVMLGDAVDTQDLAASVRTAAAPIERSMTYVDRLSNKDMPLLYGAVAASGGCLLSTSLYESQPMIVLEAMACGCPVVATDVGGLREIVADGETGHLYQPGNVQGAVTAVLRLLNERDHREAVVSAAMDYVHRTHTFARAADAYVSLLGEIAPLPESSG